MQAEPWELYAAQIASRRDFFGFGLNAQTPPQRSLRDELQYEVRALLSPQVQLRKNIDGLKEDSPLTISLEQIAAVPGLQHAAAGLRILGVSQLEIVYSRPQPLEPSTDPALEQSARILEQAKQLAEQASHVLEEVRRSSGQARMPPQPPEYTRETLTIGFERRDLAWRYELASSIRRMRTKENPETPDFLLQAFGRDQPEAVRSYLSQIVSLDVPELRAHERVQYRELRERLLSAQQNVASVLETVCYRRVRTNGRGIHAVLATMGENTSLFETLRDAEWSEVLSQKPSQFSMDVTNKLLGRYSTPYSQ